MTTQALPTFATQPPTAPPVSSAPRAASSLIVVRNGLAGLEVLLLRRADREGDQNSGAVVFPGGVVEPSDSEVADHCLGLDDAIASERLNLPSGGLRYWVAAIRECFEEAGLLFAVDASGANFRNLPTSVLEAHRAALREGRIGFVDMCETLNLRLGADRLAYHSHWITPVGLPKIFDTRFFVAMMPAGQVAEEDGREAVGSFWIAPAEALVRGLKLMTVTETTLRQLCAFHTAEDAMSHARAQGTVPLVRPRVALGRRGRPVVNGHAAYAEIGRLDPLGAATASAEIKPGKPVWLSPNILRISAPNGNAMTGPGTNSYFIGAPGGDWALVDPGPSIDAHIAALKDAMPGRLTKIFVTHTHMDHSPAWRAMKALSGATTFGRVADFLAWQDETFVPDVELSGGERFDLGPELTLRVIRTPGHASNHICYLLEEDKMLLTGDHIMQGTTVVINPPDGDMAAYIDSLNLLLTEDIDWLAPGHGFLIDSAHTEVRRTVSHRLNREAKVLADVTRHGPTSEVHILARVYASTAKGLHKAAARSLRAHLLKLRTDGSLEEIEEGTWCATRQAG